MATIEYSASSTIDADPKTVYNIIADYHGGHKQILPPKYFKNLVVHRGGVGAGTEITFEGEDLLILSSRDVLAKIAKK